MTNLRDKIINKIEKDKLEPKPKWKFIIWNILAWIFGILSVIIGALAVSASIFVLVNAGWDTSVATHNSKFAFTFATLPYLWVLLLIIFTVFAYYSIKHTKHGYRHKLVSVVFMAVLASLIFGFVFFMIGAGKATDKFGERIPFHRGIEMRQQETWSNPSNGFLAGEITVLEEEEKIILTDFRGNTWDLILEEPSEHELTILRLEDKIRVIGFTKEKNSFYVCYMLPWQKSKTPSTKNERNLEKMRSNDCEGVQPYRAIKKR